MDLNEIQTRLDALVVSMADKGLVTSGANHLAYAGREPKVMIEWGQYPSTKYEVFASFDEAEAHVAALPSPEEHHRNEFLRLASVAADYGNAHGIEAEFVNPITEAMKRISSNAIAAE